MVSSEYPSDLKSSMVDVQFTCLSSYSFELANQSLWDEKLHNPFIQSGRRRGGNLLLDVRRTEDF